jgi:hypothetical protein
VECTIESEKSYNLWMAFDSNGFGDDLQYIKESPEFLSVGEGKMNQKILNLKPNNFRNLFFFFFQS